MIHSTIPNLIIGRVYFEGEYSRGLKLQGIFIGKTQDEVEHLICQQYNIEEGKLEDWANRNHWNIDFTET